MMAISIDLIDTYPLVIRSHQRHGERQRERERGGRKDKGDSLESKKKNKRRCRCYCWHTSTHDFLLVRKKRGEEENALSRISLSLRVWREREEEKEKETATIANSFLFPSLILLTWFPSRIERTTVPSNETKTSNDSETLPIASEREGEHEQRAEWSIFPASRKGAEEEEGEEEQKKATMWNRQISSDLASAQLRAERGGEKQICWLIKDRQSNFTRFFSTHAFASIQLHCWKISHWSSVEIVFDQSSASCSRVYFFVDEH